MKEVALAALMLVQAACIVFFVMDVIDDYLDATPGVWSRPHFAIEVIANLSLIAAMVFEGAYLVRLLRRQARADRALSVASGALNEVMEGYFADWGLTPSEADVARFTIKGCSIAEIARFRGSAEGTVKTHLNAIYRKSGMQGRAQLVNLLIEELLSAPLLPPEARAVRADPAPVRSGR